MGFGRNIAIIVLLLILIGAVYAIPGIPSQFYGSVTVNGALANGATITAKINGVEMASTTSVNGAYGFNPNTFLVQDPNGSNNGKTIEFFLNSTKVAEAVFETGGYRQLDLFLGSAPVCGDHTCNSNENCSNCAQDCGACPTVGTGGGGGGSGGSGSGIVLPALTLSISGACIGEQISVNATSNGNLVSGATITARHNLKEVATKTTEANGTAIFNFNEVGVYSFTAAKSQYSNGTGSIELTFCGAPTNTNPLTIGTGNTGENAANLCENINCDDKNPCTQESCTSGVCNYANLDGASCGNNGICNQGECTTQTSANEGAMLGATGLFGLGSAGFFGLGQTGSYLFPILIIILIGLVVAFFIIQKRKNE